MTLNRNTPLKAKSGFKSKGKGLKSNSSLKSGSKLKSNSVLSGKSKLKSKTKVNAKSSKQKAIDVEYRSAKERMFKERDHVCTGCNSVTGIDNLTHSHLIPRSRRRDLVSEYTNITYHCIECHGIWESVDRVKLLDYDVNMNIVKGLDPYYYELLILKQKMWGNH